MSRDNQRESQGTRFNIFMMIMILVTFFAPAHVQLSEWSNYVIAMTWQLASYQYNYNFMFSPLMLIASLPFTFLRPIFVAMFYRLYKGKSTRRRVLVVGLLSEFLVETIFFSTIIIQLIIYPWGIFGFPLLFPVPLLFGLGILYMKLVHPPEDTSWIEEAEPDYWWTQKEEDKQQEKTTSDIWVDDSDSETETETEAHN